MQYADHLEGRFDAAAVAVDAAGVADEGWADPEHGGVTWRALIDADRTPSAGLTVGIMSVGPHARLAPHRHSPAEVYHCLDGEGWVTVDGVDYDLRPGITVFIPANAEHTTAGGAGGVKILYTFPTDRLADVDYCF
ncbi:MAG: cupin domain-containing protein [Paracoccaceae bacterium]|nr:cupin domain-containing protein [Paracoccaceae bacterium]